MATLIANVKVRPSPGFCRLKARLTPGLALLIILALFCFLIGLRNQLVVRAPFIAQLYAAAGLQVNPTGIEFREIEARTSAEGDQLLVEGEIENITSGKRKIAALDIALISRSGKIVYRWMAEVPKKTLSAGENIRFRTRLEKPPADFTSVQVKLVR